MTRSKVNVLHAESHQHILNLKQHWDGLSYLINEHSFLKDKNNNSVYYRDKILQSQFRSQQNNDIGRSRSAKPATLNNIEKETNKRIAILNDETPRYLENVHDSKNKALEHLNILSTHNKNAPAITEIISALNRLQNLENTLAKYVKTTTLVTSSTSASPASASHKTQNGGSLSKKLRKRILKTQRKKLSKSKGKTRKC
jgi:hypothetical protein